MTHCVNFKPIINTDLRQQSPFIVMTRLTYEYRVWVKCCRFWNLKHLHGKYIYHCIEGINMGETL